MKLLLGLLFALAVGAGLAADATYKWVDEKGVTNYGEKPPPSSLAQPVDTHPGAIIESGSQFSHMTEGEGRFAVEAPKPQPAAAPMPVSAARGMDFDVYIRLQSGMTEGELLLRAGKPDHEGVESFRYDIVKSYYYFPTVANPYITVVTLRGGRIANLERTRKF
jgi:Domain of unknown function (DUF4124)